MILDRLENLDRYTPLNANLVKALAFLRQANLAEIPEGRYEIDGTRVYAMVQHAPARPHDGATMETHRRYIDVQLVLSGTDDMGWKNLERCTSPQGEYDPIGDNALFADVPDAWISVSPGAFVIFFPGDVHAPNVGSGMLHKIVVKVAVE